MKESKYFVYMHIAPNGKKYIGITSQSDPNRRWQNGSGYRSQTLFYRAIKKYGWSDFDHVIIASGLCKKEAEEMEIRLIKEHATTDPKYGYNIENGGNCFGTHSEETKRKISEAQRGEKNHMYGKHSWSYGKKMSAELIEKNRLAHLGQPAPNKGKKMSEAQKAKLRRPKSEEHKRKLSIAKSVPVVCVETGKIYKSSKAAGEALGISRATIAKVARGIGKTAGGYHWQFV